MAPVREAAPLPPSSDESLTWDFALPLLTSRFLWWDVAKVLTISLFLTQVVVGAASYLIGGELWILPLRVLAAVGLVLIALLVLTAGLVYRNAFHATVEITPEGVGFRSGNRERGLNRLAVIGGLLAGSAGVAGAGMVATSREDTWFGWEDVHDVTVHPGARVLSLRSRWRTLLRLHCPPDVFDRAAALTDDYVTRAARWRDRHPASSPVPTRRSYPAVALWGGIALATTFATQAMFYIDSETLRLALAGGLLVVSAGVLTGIPMLASVVMAFLVNCWLVLATFDAVTPYTETGEFLVSAAGALLLLVMTVARPFVQPLNPRATHAPS